MDLPCRHMVCCQGDGDEDRDTLTMTEQSRDTDSSQSPGPSGHRRGMVMGSWLTCVALPSILMCFVCGVISIVAQVEGYQRALQLEDLYKSIHTQTVVPIYRPVTQRPTWMDWTVLRRTTTHLPAWAAYWQPGTTVASRGFTDVKLYHPINIYNVWPGMSSGVVFLVLGVMVTLMTYYRTRTLVYITMVMSATTLVLSSVTMISVVEIVTGFYRLDTHATAPEIAVQHSFDAQMCMGMGALMVSVCSMMSILSVLILIFCSKILDCCCFAQRSSEATQDRHSGRQDGDHVFTINTLPRPVYYDHDMSAPMLQDQPSNLSVSLPGLPTYEQSQEMAR